MWISQSVHHMTHIAESSCLTKSQSKSALKNRAAHCHWHCDCITSRHINLLKCKVSIVQVCISYKVTVSWCSCCFLVHSLVFIIDNKRKLFEWSEGTMEELFDVVNPYAPTPTDLTFGNISTTKRGRVTVCVACWIHIVKTDSTNNKLHSVYHCKILIWWNISVVPVCSCPGKC